MKITWLGQAGLLFEQDGFTVLVDPYLSDSVGEVNPALRRRVAVEERFLQIRPDVIVCTHNHADHTDPKTLRHYLGAKEQAANYSVTVLTPGAAWEAARKFGGDHNYILFNHYTEVTVGSVRFLAVKAAHSDPDAIGVILDWGGKLYYHTGDTLYSKDIFADIPTGIDTLFLPINGVGNNMNAVDASRFAKRIDAKRSVPLHWGLFDDLDPAAFQAAGRVIPTIYQEIGEKTI